MASAYDPTCPEDIAVEDFCPTKRLQDHHLHASEVLLAIQTVEVELDHARDLGFTQVLDLRLMVDALGRLSLLSKFADEWREELEGLIPDDIDEEHFDGDGDHEDYDSSILPVPPAWLQSVDPESILGPGATVAALDQAYVLASLLEDTHERCEHLIEVFAHVVESANLSPALVYEDATLLEADWAMIRPAIESELLRFLDGLRSALDAIKLQYASASSAGVLPTILSYPPSPAPALSAAYPEVDASLFQASWLLQERAVWLDQARSFVDSPFVSRDSSGRTYLLVELPLTQDAVLPDELAWLVSSGVQSPSILCRDADGRKGTCTCDAANVCSPANYGSVLPLPVDPDVSAALSGQPGAVTPVSVLATVAAMDFPALVASIGPGEPLYPFRTMGVRGEFDGPPELPPELVGTIEKSNPGLGTVLEMDALSWLMPTELGSSLPLAMHGFLAGRDLPMDLDQGSAGMFELIATCRSQAMGDPDSYTAVTAPPNFNWNWFCNRLLVGATASDLFSGATIPDLLNTAWSTLPSFANTTAQMTGMPLGNGWSMDINLLVNPTLSWTSSPENIDVATAAKEDSTHNELWLDVRAQVDMNVTWCANLNNPSLGIAAVRPCVPKLQPSGGLDMGDLTGGYDVIYDVHLREGTLLSSTWKWVSTTVTSRGSGIPPYRVVKTLRANPIPLPNQVSAILSAWEGETKINQNCQAQTASGTMFLSDPNNPNACNLIDSAISAYSLQPVDLTIITSQALGLDELMNRTVDALGEHLRLFATAANPLFHAYQQATETGPNVIDLVVADEDTNSWQDLSTLPLSDPLPMPSTGYVLALRGDAGILSVYHPLGLSTFGVYRKKVRTLATLRQTLDSYDQTGATMPYADSLWFDPVLGSGVPDGSGWSNVLVNSNINANGGLQGYFRAATKGILKSFPGILSDRQVGQGFYKNLSDQTQSFTACTYLEGEFQPDPTINVRPYAPIWSEVELIPTIDYQDQDHGYRIKVHLPLELNLHSTQTTRTHFVKINASARPYSYWGCMGLQEDRDNSVLRSKRWSEAVTTFPLDYVSHFDLVYEYRIAINRPWQSSQELVTAGIDDEPSDGLWSPIASLQTMDQLSQVLNSSDEPWYHLPVASRFEIRGSRMSGSEMTRVACDQVDFAGQVDPACATYSGFMQPEISQVVTVLDDNWTTMNVTQGVPTPLKNAHPSGGGDEGSVTSYIVGGWFNAFVYDETQNFGSGQSLGLHSAIHCRGQRKPAWDYRLANSTTNAPVSDLGLLTMGLRGECELGIGARISAFLDQNPMDFIFYDEFGNLQQQISYPLGTSYDYDDALALDDALAAVDLVQGIVPLLGDFAEPGAALLLPVETQEAVTLIENSLDLYHAALPGNGATLIERFRGYSNSDFNPYIPGNGVNHVGYESGGFPGTSMDNFLQSLLATDLMSGLRDSVFADWMAQRATDMRAGKDAVLVAKPRNGARGPYVGLFKPRTPCGKKWRPGLVHPTPYVVPGPFWQQAPFGALPWECQ